MSQGVIEAATYVLEENVGYLLRQVTQRHLAIFSDIIPEQITPTQFAAMAKLREQGPCSQNRLGRLTSMDVATIKGVVDRLTRRGLTESRADPDDGRRLIIRLTRDGEILVDRLFPSPAR